MHDRLIHPSAWNRNSRKFGYSCSRAGIVTFVPSPFVLVENGTFEGCARTLLVGSMLLAMNASKEEKAMIARFDHRPRLTAALALASIVLVVVVVTLATLLITSPQAASPPSVGGDNPGAAAAPANVGGVGDSHARQVADFHNNR